MRGDIQQGQGGSTADGPGAPTACVGVVVAVENGIVTVQVNTPDACDACRSKESCHQAQLAGRRVEVRGEGFKAGDRVRVMADPRAVIRGATVLYLIPTLLVITGAFAGFFTATAFFEMDGNLGSVVGVATGLVLGLLFVRFYKGADGDGGLDLKIEKYDVE